MCHVCQHSIDQSHMTKATSKRTGKCSPNITGETTNSFGEECAKKKNMGKNWEKLNAWVKNWEK